MLELFRTLSLRYLWKHWLRAGLVIASIALGVAAWVTTEALYDAVTRSMRQSASPWQGNAEFFITNNATRYLDASIGELLKREIPEVSKVEPIIIENVAVQRDDTSPAGIPIVLRSDAVLFGFELPQKDEKAEALGVRGIEVIEVDRDAMRRGLMLEKGRDWVEFLKPRIPEGTGAVFPRDMQRIASWVWNSTTVSTPVLVGEQFDKDFLQGNKHFIIASGERRFPAQVVGKLRATGPAAALGGQAVLMEWQSASRALGQPGQVQRLEVYLKPDSNREEVLKVAREKFGQHGSVQTPEEQDKRLRQVLKGLETGFRLCGAGALVVGLFLVYNAMSVSVAERRHDIGILRSTGSTRSQVRMLFLGEAVVLGTIGSLLGLPLGIGLAHLLLGPIQQGLSGIFLPMRGHEIRASAALMVTAFLAGLLTAQAAALVPASQAASEEPADAVRRAPPSASLAYRVLQIGGSLTLVLVGVFLVAVKPYLTADLVQQACLVLIVAGLPLAALGYRLSLRLPAAGDTPGTGLRALASMIYGLLFVAAGCAGLVMRDSLAAEKGTYAALVLILIGALLLTPRLAEFLTLVVQRLTRGWLPIESRLAADNLVRSPGRTGLVIAALSAGVALTVQTAGMIESNQVAYAGWIDETMKADLYIGAGGPATANAQWRPLPPSVEAGVRKQLPAGTRLVGVCYRYPTWSSSHRKGPALTGSEDDTLIFLMLIDAQQHYEANKERGEGGESLDLWRRLAKEPGSVIVSDNFARMHGVRVGEKIPLASKGRAEWQVIGTVQDYNWIRGTIWIDRQSNLEAFSAADANVWEVYLPPKEREEAHAIRDRLLQSRLGATEAIGGLTRDEVRENYLRGVYQIYSLAYTQEMLVAIVAVLGVVAALLISVLGRKRELGLLRAVGASRLQVMHTVLAEAVLIGIIGTVIGIAVGLPLEWYAVRIILFEEAGFVFPVRIPWLETAVIAALSVFCAALAGLAPAIQAVRLRIGDAIAYE